MYGLQQAGISAQELLEQHLEHHRYSQSNIVPGYWKLKDKLIDFTLITSNFGVK